MLSGSSANPNLPAARPEPQRLSPSVVGACLRSAFIEALYDDCTELLPADAEKREEPDPLPVAAE